MLPYKHLNTGAVAELIEKGETAAKMRDSETGEIREIGLATLKRWWKPIEPETPDAPMEPIEASDGAEIPEAGEYTPEDPEANMDVPGEPAPLALSDIVKKLEGVFDLLNGLYFEGALPRPVITVQSAPKAYGRCSTKKIWASGAEGEGDARYEINIGAEYLNRPSENTAATMLHEMVHLYCRENGIAETCQGGRYHNRLFKAEAEGRDLEIEYTRSAGYTVTTPSDALIGKLREAGYALEIPFARHTLGERRAKARRNKAYKYECNECGQAVRSASELSLLCGICKVEMERA